MNSTRGEKGARSPRFPVPRLSDLSAEFRSAEDDERKVDELLSAKREQLKNLQRLAHAALQRADDEQNAPTVSALDRVLGRAPAEYSAPLPIADFTEEIAAIERDLREIEAAAKIAREKSASARFKAVTIANDRLAEPFNDLARDICHGLLRFRGLVLAYAEMLEACREEGIYFTSIKPLMFHGLGDPTDRYSVFGDYLNAAAHLGVIPASDIPPELR